jgi:hypothetical protein
MAQRITNSPYSLGAMTVSLPKTLDLTTTPTTTPTTKTTTTTSILSPIKTLTTSQNLSTASISTTPIKTVSLSKIPSCANPYTNTEIKDFLNKAFSSQGLSIASNGDVKIPTYSIFALATQKVLRPLEATLERLIAQRELLISSIRDLETQIYNAQKNAGTYADCTPELERLREIIKNNMARRNGYESITLQETKKLSKSIANLTDTMPNIQTKMDVLVQIVLSVQTVLCKAIQGVSDYIKILMGNESRKKAELQALLSTNKSQSYSPECQAEIARLTEMTQISPSIIHIAPQETPSQETPPQETPSQETPSQETPSQIRAEDTFASEQGNAGFVSTPEKSTTPWGWILGGAVVLVGAGYWISQKNKASKT